MEYGNDQADRLAKARAQKHVWPDSVKQAFAIRRLTPILQGFILKLVLLRNAAFEETHKNLPAFATASDTEDAAPHVCLESSQSQADLTGAQEPSTAPDPLIVSWLDLALEAYPSFHWKPAEWNTRWPCCLAPPIANCNRKGTPFVQWGFPEDTLHALAW